MLCLPLYALFPPDCVYTQTVKALGACVLDGKVVGSTEQGKDHMRGKVSSSKLRISYECDMEKKVPD